jgi:predicted ribosome quality control (RQC) complex YloA/Tae2 family protein
MRERLAAASDELYLLRTQEELVRDAVDRRELDAAHAVLAKHGYIRDKGVKAGRGRSAAPSPYRVVSFEGWDILVGKSAAGNDYITLKLARPDDLWLHAEGMPGSHVVVRNPQRRDIPERVLRHAASLAAWHSKGKGSAKVAVAYTRAALVKKPKGAAPGAVILSGRRTIMAAPRQE